MNNSYKTLWVLLASACASPLLTYYVFPPIVPIGPMVLIVNFLLFLALMIFSLWSIFVGLRLKKHGKPVAGIITMIAGILVSLFSALFIFVGIQIFLHGFQA